jgi:hypothetical protein
VRTIAHIDGDILVYAGGFAAEKGQYAVTWTDEEGTEHTKLFTYKKDAYAYALTLPSRFVVEFQRIPEPVSHALHNVSLTITSIKENLGVDDYVVHLSGTTNFRNGLATIRPYKGNRDKAHKPVHGPAIREYVLANHPHVVSADEEADDVIGYMHYARFLEDPESSIICSMDKDLNMIPGHHYNFYKKERSYVTPEQADYNFYKQLLTGDTTDNIQGCPGIGHKKAERLLAGLEGDPQMMFEVCQQAYDQHYKCDATAQVLENARLLWIRRKEKEIWQPPPRIEWDNQLSTPSTQSESTK